MGAWEHPDGDGAAQHNFPHRKKQFQAENAKCRDFLRDSAYSI
jgi:hypothetical protein